MPKSFEESQSHALGQEVGESHAQSPSAGPGLDVLRTQGEALHPFEARMQARAQIAGSRSPMEALEKEAVYIECLMGAPEGKGNWHPFKDPTYLDKIREIKTRWASDSSGAGDHPSPRRDLRSSVGDDLNSVAEEQRPSFVQGSSTRRDGGDASSSSSRESSPEELTPKELSLAKLYNVLAKRGRLHEVTPEIKAAYNKCRNIAHVKEPEKYAQSLEKVSDDKKLATTWRNFINGTKRGFSVNSKEHASTTAVLKAFNEKVEGDPRKADKGALQKKHDKWKGDPHAYVSDGKDHYSSEEDN